MPSSPSGLGELPPLPPLVPVRSGGVTLAVRRLGEGAESAPGLVALHGGPGLDHHTLLTLGLALAARRRVWLPDLPGHGASAAPTGKLPGLRALEDRLERWVAGLPGGEPPVLLGHSLGAWLVRELLRRRRVEPRAAVLLAPPAAGQRRAETSLRRAVGVMARASAPGPVVGSGGEHRARRELRSHVEAETRNRASELFLESIHRARLRDPRLYGPLLRSLHRGLTGPVRPFDPGCPILVLCGEEDRTTPPDQAARVAASLVGARLVHLPGAGHYPFAEALEATVQRIEEFLSAVSGS